MAFSGSSKITLSRTYTRTVELVTVSAPYSVQHSQTWVDGDVLNGNQLVYSKNDAAIDGSGGSATSYDLVATLLDPITGTAQTWTKVREIFIKNNTTTAGSTLKVNGNFITTVVLGGTTPFLVIGAGGVLHILCPSLAGYAVTSTTGDVITLQGNTAAAVSVDLFLAGAGTVA